MESLGAEGGSAAHRVLYALAFVQWKISQLPDGPSGIDGPSGNQRKTLLKDAQAQADRILEENPEHAEALALKGSVLGGRITGGLSGMLLGPNSSASMDRALGYAPDNARVALQHRISLFHMPKSFGGGAEPAEIELLRARELFRDRPAGEEWPYWGRLDVLVWLGQSAAKLGKLEEARALYPEVLELEPDFAWVRDELLPGLEP